MGLYGNTFLNESVVKVSDSELLSMSNELSLFEFTFKQDMLLESVFDDMDIINEAEGENVISEKKKGVIRRIIDKLREGLSTLIKFLKGIKDKIKDLFSKFFSKSKDMDKEMEKMKDEHIEKNRDNLELEYYNYFELIEKTSVSFRRPASWFDSDDNFKNVSVPNRVRDIIIKTFVTSYKDYFSSIKDGMSVSDMKDRIAAYHSTVDKKTIKFVNFDFKKNLSIVKKFNDKIASNYKEMNAAIDENIKKAEQYRRDLEKELNDSLYKQSDFDKYDKYTNIKYTVSDDKKNVSWELKPEDQRVDKWQEILPTDDNIQNKIRQQQSKIVAAQKKYDRTNDIPAFINLSTTVANVNTAIFKELCYICMKAKSENYRLYRAFYK